MKKSLIKCISVLQVILLTGFGNPAFSLPEFRNGVVPGNVTLNNEVEGKLNITVPDRVVLDFDSFDIASGEAVNFDQPSSSSVALNRVHGSSQTVIDGFLGANGRIFLLNSNGILFGASAVVDTAGFVAAAMEMSDSDFLSGNYRFSGDAGNIVNKGKISVKDGGFVGLIGEQVTNSGTLTAKRGDVVLAAGKKVSFDLDGSGLVNLSVTGESAKALIKNSGKINADGGKVILNAERAAGVLDTVINNPGVISANAISGEGGVIRLVSNGGAIKHSGTINASQGEVTIEGSSVEISGHIKADSGSVTLKSGGETLDQHSDEETDESTLNTEESAPVENPAQTAAENVLPEVETDSGVADSNVAGDTLIDDIVVSEEILPEINLNTGEILNSGIIDVSGTTNASGGSINVLSQNITNAGVLTATGSEGGIITLTATGDILQTESGKMEVHDGQISLKADHNIELEGDIKATGDSEIRLEARNGSIHSSATIEATEGSVALKAEGEVVSEGILRAGNLTEEGATFILGGTAEIGFLHAENADNALVMTTGNYSGFWADVQDIILRGVISLTGDLVLVADYGALVSGPFPSPVSPSSNGLGRILMQSYLVGPILLSTLILGNGHDLHLYASQNSTLQYITGVDQLTINETLAGSNPTFNQTRNLTVNDFTLNSGTFSSNPNNVSFNTTTNFTLNGGRFLRFTSGDGSMVDPYLIEDVYGLQAISQSLDSYYELAQAITAASSSTWNGGLGFDPIGSYSNPFTGSLDGNDEIISGLTIDRGAEDQTGLFGALSGAQINDLTLTDVDITGKNYVGGLAGLSQNSEINGIQVVNDPSINGNSGTGGIVGYMVGGTLSDSAVTGVVNGSSSTGGLLGHSENTTVSNSRVDVTVTGNTDTGGAIGKNLDSQVDGLNVVADVSGVSRTGGAVGYNQNSILSNFDVSGQVSGTSSTGGIVGRNVSGQLLMSENQSTVTGTNNTGGVIGNLESGVLSDIQSQSTVNGVNYAGGIAGVSQNATVSNISATTTVSGMNFIGGIIGYDTSSVISNITNNSIVTGDSAVGGVVAYAKNSTISGINATTDVTGSRVTGGLFAALDASTVSGSVNNSVVQGQLLTGGVAGIIDSSMMTNLTVESGVTGNLMTGGVVGSARLSDISNMVANTTVTGSDNHTGGVIGWNIDSSTDNIQVISNVSGQRNVGGFIGTAENSVISNTVVQTSVSGTENTGGLIGQSQLSNIQNGRVSGTVNGDIAVGGALGLSQSSTVSGINVRALTTGNLNTGGFTGVEVSGSVYTDNTWCSDVAQLQEDQDIGNMGDVDGITDICGPESQEIIVLDTVLKILSNIVNTTEISESVTEIFSEWLPHSYPIGYLFNNFLFGSNQLGLLPFDQAVGYQFPDEEDDEEELV